jgi:hypothetical protein
MPAWSAEAWLHDTAPHPTIARLEEAANKVRETRDRTTLLRVVNG